MYCYLDGMIVSHLPYGPTAYFNISNTVMRHDIPNVGTMSEAYPHLIFHNFTTPLGKRVSLIFTPRRGYCNHHVCMMCGVAFRTFGFSSERIIAIFWFVG